MLKEILLSVALLTTACAPVSTGMTIAAEGEFFDEHSQVLTLNQMVLKGDSKAKELAALTAFLQGEGFYVEETEMDDDYFGLTTLGSIYVNSKMPVNARFNTLLHEAAHNLHPCLPEHTKQEREVFAETVALIVGRKFGLDSYLQTFSYLTLKVDPADRRALLIEDTLAIDAAVKKLADGIRLHLKN